MGDAIMSARLIVDNTRPRPLPPLRTNCFSDEDGRPICGTPAPQPCPFCRSGCEELQLVRFADDGYEDGECEHSNAPDCGCVYHVDCMGCGAEGPHTSTAVEAAEGWNRRPSEVRS
jgi:hypothetical protein